MQKKEERNDLMFITGSFLLCEWFSFTSCMMGDIFSCIELYSVKFSRYIMMAF